MAYTAAFPQWLFICWNPSPSFPTFIVVSLIVLLLLLLFLAVYWITFHLSPTAQVQEVPVEKFRDSKLYPSPVLYITASKDVTFLRPVTLKIPMSLDEDFDTLPTQFSCDQLRILFRKSENSEDGAAQWEDITDKVKESLQLVDNVVIFQVRHFSG